MNCPIKTNRTKKYEISIFSVKEETKKLPFVKQREYEYTDNYV